MNCTHPVLYNHPDGLRCHICGALVRSDAQDDKQEEHETKPAETQKKPVKHKAKAAE